MKNGENAMAPMNLDEIAQMLVALDEKLNSVLERLDRSGVPEDRALRTEKVEGGSLALPVEYEHRRLGSVVRYVLSLDQAGMDKLRAGMGSASIYRGYERWLVSKRAMGVHSLQAFGREVTRTRLFSRTRVSTGISLRLVDGYEDVLEEYRRDIEKLDALWAQKWKGNPSGLSKLGLCFPYQGSTSNVAYLPTANVVEDEDDDRPAPHDPISAPGTFVPPPPARTTPVEVAPVSMDDPDAPW